MLKMSQSNYIRDLHNCGYSAKEIQEKTNADPKTICKYLNPSFSHAYSIYWVIRTLWLNFLKSNAII